MDLLPLYLVVAAIVFAAVTLALIDPLLVVMLAVPGALIVHRVGGASLNLSGSDVLTVAATAIALPFLRTEMRATRGLLWIAVWFQAILLFTVVAHPTARGVLEWGHRFFLVGGSITIGGVLGRTRRAGTAAAMFLVLTTALAVTAVATTLTNGLAPAYPFGLQKNFVGAMTASAVMLAVLRPAWIRLTRAQSFWVALICAGGLLASQSRGAMLALGFALVIAAVRQGHLSRRGLLAVVVAAPLVAFAVVSVWHESDDPEINSLTYRADYSSLAYREWHRSPIVGQGLRFFKEPGALLQSDAHNVIPTTLAEGGIVGLAALAVLVGLTLVALWHLPAQTGAIAIAFVGGRFVHGLFDVYWVAGTTTLPWFIAGIACGTADADAAVQPATTASSPRAPVARRSRR